MFFFPLIASLVLGWSLSRTRFCFYRWTDPQAVRKHAISFNLLFTSLAIALIHGLVLLFSDPEIVVNLYAFKHSMWIGCVIFAWGVWVNRACTWGSLVQLGERNWTYLFTFAGLYFGVVSDAFWGKALDPVRASGIEENAWQSPWAWGIVAIGIVALYFFRKKISFKWSTVSLIPWILLALSAIVLTYFGHGIFINNGIRFITSTREDAWTFGLVAVVTMIGAICAGLPAASVHLKWRNIPRHLMGGFLMGVASFMIPGGTEEWLLRDTPFLLTQGWIALLLVACILFVFHFIFSRHRTSVDAPM
ncbi:MAG: hypothetical protein ACKO66_06535 [Flavobacteriales bacterium]